MREPQPVSGSRALLFERLTDSRLGVRQEPRPFRILTRGELLESVAREVHRILNTRCRVAPGEGERTVIDYGVPDFSYLSAASETNMISLSHLIERTVAAFEPRLKEVRVILTPSPASPTGAVGVIEGRLVAGMVNEPVSFPLALDTKSGEINVPLA